MVVEVRLERCDLGDRAAVSLLFERIRRAGVPLRGLFHTAAAGTEPVGRIQASDLAAAFRPKVDGTLFLDEQSRAFELDFFVLFSSAAGVLGARGQGHYAAASAFLDAVATSRRAASLPGLSIDWGLWGGDERPQVPYFRRVGLNPMAPETAFDAMARLLSAQAGGQRVVQPLVASLDGDRLRSALELRGRARVLSALATDTLVRESAEGRALTELLRNVPTVLRRGAVADVIAAEVRAVMELTTEDTLSVDRGFFDLGMDSLMTVALKIRLEERFGMSLPSTLAMDYPSVAALAGYFEAVVAGTGPDPIETVGVRAPETNPAPGLARAVEELSDDEVGDALAAELKALDLELLK